MATNREALEEATGEKKIYHLDFRFGAFGAAVPLLFFVIWAITISVLQLSSESGLVLGAIIGLTLGLLLCNSRWADYAYGLFDGLEKPIGVIGTVAWVDEGRLE